MNSNLMEVFLNELNSRILNILKGISENNVSLILMEIHALKGTSQMMGFKDIAFFIHKMEDKIKKDGLNEQNKILLKKFIKALPIAINSENKKTLEEIFKEKNNIIVKDNTIPINIKYIYNVISVLIESYNINDLTKIRDIISNAIKELYELLMIPIIDILKPIEREGKRIAETYNKMVKFKFNTNNVKIDKELADMIKRILIVMIRNIISHGIEEPNIRLRKGKTEWGNIDINILRESDRIKIIILDDGKGLYNKRLQKIAKEKNISIEEVVFIENVSSKEKTDIIAGRGMGLSEIKTLINAKGGTINVKTKRDKFTRFIIELPYSIITDYYYVFSINDLYIAFHRSDIYSITTYHKHIKFENYFNLDKGILLHLTNNKSILVSDFKSKVERYMYNLPDIFKNTIYKGWFTYRGKPCFVVNINNLSNVKYAQQRVS